MDEFFDLAEDERSRNRYGFALTDCQARDMGTGPQSPWQTCYMQIRICHRSGVELHLTGLQQSPSYLGQLCGLPMIWPYYLKQAESTAMALHPDHAAKCAILQPELLNGSVIRQRDGDIQEERWRGLPAIHCTAEFQYPAPEDSPHIFCSIVVTWWQMEYGQPDARAMRQIAELDLQPISYGWDP